jgi:hypothetical protein
LHPAIFRVLCAFIEHCDNNWLPCVITNFIIKFFESETDSHPDGRAFDASVRGWQKEQIDAIVALFNELFEDIAAISRKDGVRRCCVYHDVGLGSHLHFQVGIHAIIGK